MNGPEALPRAWHLSSVIFSQLKLPVCPSLGIWAELQHSPVSKVLLGHAGWAWQPCPHPTQPPHECVLQQGEHRGGHSTQLLQV